MSQEVIDTTELSEFLTMVDNIVEDLKSGKIKANPLKTETLENVTETTKFMGTITEKGEDELESTDLMIDVALGDEILLESTLSGVDIEEAEEQEEVEDNRAFDATTSLTINNKEFFAHTIKYLVELQNTYNKIVNVQNSQGLNLYFATAAAAAKETGFNPTTIRERCTKNYVDNDNNTWCYVL